ncbi:LysM peptidoglycan-binding domain-containing protein [Pseudomonas sp. ABC1]|uniref:LysM peptidoglycan-binding domain-containing protein n=1 Tax=Pseudomonas sp. ABC1 TaxID=2748080 RepID=UPI0015C34939|nr:LysM peptidoglycan-binding domain-containing protein [Pseudomonas sp. ABC1]QLF93418.1 LysM peptidoglycan-binding domain-containing protein [Pseudomonas sp. ABC1]
MRKSLLVLLLLAISGLAQAQTALREDHPQSYTVTESDTLWDIATRFLDEPWEWPALWLSDAPQALHVGDRLELTLIDGQPRLSLTATETAPPQPIPDLPRQPTQAALPGQRILDDLAPLTVAPYVVAGNDERTLAGKDERIHGRGRFDTAQTHYDVVRESKTYVDPVSQEVLGIGVTDIGNAEVKRIEADIATLRLTSATQEVRLGDRLLPAETAASGGTLIPGEPAHLVEGQIIDTPQAGQQEIVTLNRGSREGLAPGHILAIYKTGERSRDPLTGEWVKLPDERTGLLMVFDTHEKLSHGLVLQTSQPPSTGDKVRNP